MSNQDSSQKIFTQKKEFNIDFKLITETIFYLKIEVLPLISFTD